MYDWEFGYSATGHTENIGKLVSGSEGFPSGSACSAGDPGLIPGLGRSPGEGNGYPFQYSYLEHSLAGHRQWGHKESNVTEGLKHLLYFMSFRENHYGEIYTEPV